MSWKVVKHDGHGSERVLVSQSKKKLFELVLVNRLLKTHYHLHSVLFTDGSNHSGRLLVVQLHIDLEWAVLHCPRSFNVARPREANFVHPQNCFVFTFGLNYFLFVSL